MIMLIVAPYYGDAILSLHRHKRRRCHTVELDDSYTIGRNLSSRHDNGVKLCSWGNAWRTKK